MNLAPKQIIFTLANGLTFLRALSAFPIVLAIQHKSLWIYPLIIFCALSDMLDGYLARLSDRVTEIGCILDPTADSLVVAAIMSYFYFNKMIPGALWWFIFCRYFLIGLMALVLWINFKYISRANFYGKISVILTGLYLITLIFEFPPLYTSICLYPMIFFQVISFLFYCQTFRIITLQKQLV